MLNEAMPIVGKLINRYQNEAVIDIGNMIRILRI